MAFKGFEPDVVTDSINKVKQAYEDFNAAMVGDVQSQFINGMADKWACTQAIEFFTTFKEVIDRIVESTNITIESVVNAMNGGAKIWAAETKTSWSDISFEATSYKLSIGGIKENISGARGIDTEARAVASKLSGILSTANAAINSLRTAVVECGFIDATESSNLQQSIAAISTAMRTVTDDVLEGCNKAIESTVSSYEEASGRIATAYAGQ